MSALDFIKLGRFLNRTWKHTELFVAVRDEDFIVTDRCAMYRVPRPRSPEVFRATQVEIALTILGLPSGCYRLQQEQDAEALDDTTLRFWTDGTTNRGDDLHRTSLLYEIDSNTRMRWFTPGVWVDDRYDQIIHHSPKTRPLYFRSTASSTGPKDSVIVESSGELCALIMPMHLPIADDVLNKAREAATR